MLKLHPSRNQTSVDQSSCISVPRLLLGPVLESLQRNAAKVRQMLHFATGVKKFQYMTPTYVVNNILRFNDRMDYMCIY